MREPIVAAALLNLVMLTMACAAFAVPVMAPAISTDLGVDASLLTAYTAMMWTASMATSIGAGNLIARFGAIRVSQLCLALCAIGMAVTALGVLPSIAIAAVLIGLGHGAETPASSVLLARVTPTRHHPFIFSLKQTGVQFGGIASGFAFPWLYAMFGWRGALLIVMAVIIAMTVVLELCRERYEGSSSIGAVGSASHRPSLTFRAALRIVWHDHRLRRLSLASFALIAAQISLNSFLVTFLVREAGYGLAAAGSLLAAVQLGGLIGRLTWGAIAGRVVPAHTLVAMLGAGTMIGLALLGTFGTGMASGPLAVLCFFAGATAAGWNGVFLAEVARLAPAGEIARITGASFVLGSLGLLVGPLVFGAVARTWSFGLAYCVMAASALVGVAILLQGGPPRNDRRPRSI